MLRSLWSGVTGLKTHQIEMDVIGNNIANVNTTSFKSQAAGFKDILYQTERDGYLGGANMGSTNISQVGLGVKMGSVFTNISTQGSAMTTNNALDLMITGPSFFMVRTGTGGFNDGSISYTRDGSFNIDANGYLVTQSEGYYVQGVAGEDGIPMGGTVVVQNLHVINRNMEKVVGVDANGNNVIQKYDGVPGEATGAAHMKGNLDSEDTTLKSGMPVMMDAYGTDGTLYTLKFQFDDAGDEDGSTFRLSLQGVTNQNGVTQNATMQPMYLEYDKSNGLLKTVTQGTEVINYYQNDSGRLVSDYPLYLNFTGDTTLGSIEFDLTYTHNYASTTSSHNSAVFAYKGDTDGDQKGYASGELNGISFGTDGSIYGSYTNGKSVKKGQIAVAEFSNAMGLEKIGDNLYAASVNSGNPQVQDITWKGNYMQSGVLEGSNVDLAKEFTDMITTQRGFQANSKVITTSDEMLQILKGLKR